MRSLARWAFTRSNFIIEAWKFEEGVAREERTDWRIVEETFREAGGGEVGGRIKQFKEVLEGIEEVRAR